MRSPSRSDSPVKPAISANRTVSGWIEPPGRGSTPSRTSILTRSAGMYFRKAASPPAMSAMAPDRFSISVTPEAWRRTLSRSKRATCLSSSTTTISGVGDDAPGQPCRQQAGGENQDGEADQQFPDRRLDRPEKFLFRDHGRQRPAEKGERCQRDRIGLAGLFQPDLTGGLLLAGRSSPACSMARRRDRQQRLVGRAACSVRRRPDRARRSMVPSLPRMNAAPDLPTESCDRNWARRVYSMMMARTPWRFW